LRRGNRDIYVIDADGRNERRLTTDPVNDFAPDWSPDGARIAWTSARSGHLAVYTMNVDGSDVRQVTPDSLEGGFPGWSPDGKQILFSDALCATCTESDLWVVSADGSGLRQITNTPANELAKSWSSDGKSVLGEFSKFTPSEKHPGSSDVAVWDAATGALTKLTNDDRSKDRHPDWSAGGRAWVIGARRMVAGADPRGEHELQPSDTAPWSRVGGGAASIEYTLPKAGHVRVRVYDAAGHEVARPVDEWQSAGRHQTTFAFGAAPNQVFRYRVECDGRKTSGKIETGP
jgi:Tol biopolymer transport system component